MNEAELDRIAEQAAELTEPERLAFINEACGGDEKAVNLVLAFLAFEPPDDFVADEERSGLDLLGATLGDYTVVDQIGEGGSSVVYSAVQSHEDIPKYAIKLLRPDVANSSSIVGRFAAEQEVLQRMQHPNIAALIESGIFEDRPFFVMELVRGGLAITDYCHMKKLPLEDRLRLFESTCDAVVHAHQQGIIHRDIKPTNILIELDQVTGVESPKLIDFGIAKALEPNALDSLIQTSHGEFIGTRSYATPEQIRGDGTDSRTDIYCLGLILYELLTDRPAIDVSSQPDMQQLKNLICNESVPMPSDVSRENDGQRISADLDWIVLMALEKKPEKRYQTVDAFVGDVRNFRLGKRVKAHPRSFWYDTKNFVYEHRLLSLAFVILCISFAITASFGYRTKQAERAAARLLVDVQRGYREKSVALQRAREADAQSAQHLQKLQRINKTLASVIGPPKESTPKELEISHRDRLKRASLELAGILAGEPIIEAHVRLMLAESFRLYGDLEIAFSEVQKSMKLCENLDPSHPDRLQCEHQMAYMHLMTGQLMEAYDLAQSVIDRYQNLAGEPARFASQTKLLLSDIHATRGQPTESLSILTAIKPSDLPASSADDAALRTRLASVHTSLGDHERAFENLKQLLKAYQARYGESHSATLDAQHRLATNYLARKQAKMAEALLRDALAKSKAAQLNGDQVVEMIRDLAGALSWLGRKREAEILLLEAIMTEQETRPGQSGHPGSLIRYARLLRDRKAFAEAEAIMRFLPQSDVGFLKSHIGSAAFIETMASIFEDQAKYRNELYWKTRLLIAYLRHYGWQHDATRKTAWKVSEVAILYAAQLVTTNNAIIGLELLQDHRKAMVRPRRKPMVVKTGNEMMLQWVDLDPKPQETR